MKDGYRLHKLYVMDLDDFKKKFQLFLSLHSCDWSVQLIILYPEMFGMYIMQILMELFESNNLLSHNNTKTVLQKNCCISFKWTKDLTRGEDGTCYILMKQLIYALK